MVLGGGKLGIGVNLFLTVVQVTDISRFGKSAESAFLSMKGEVSCGRRAFGKRCKVWSYV